MFGFGIHKYYKEDGDKFEDGYMGPVLSDHETPSLRADPKGITRRSGADLSSVKRSKDETVYENKGFAIVSTLNYGSSATP